MSQVQPVGGNPDRRGEVRAAIARAAAATGVDFDYLLAQARIESSLDPAARAGTSSAAGLYQFTNGTWLATLQQHGDAHDLPMPASRAEALALRYDPQAAALMAAELAGDNAEALQGMLGRAPDAAELYLAHFLGAGGAKTFLGALAQDPNQSAAALLPQAAAANRAVFFDGAGAPRSVGAVMELLRSKVQAAMGNTELPSPSGEGLGVGPVEWSLRFPDIPHPNPSPEGEGLKGVFRNHPSMAETLAATFGASAVAPDNVRSAYTRLRSFGL